jgi:hypothetical protein
VTHYDEHIIELYVLRSETVEDRREEIERHLAECHGCRSLALEVERFYDGFEKALGERGAGEPVNATALTRAPRSLEPYFEPYTAISDLRGASLTGRMRYFIRRYPIAVGASGFAFAAALIGFALLRPGRTTAPSDTNPAYHHINPEAGTLEIYNRDNQKLWDLPSRGLYNATAEGIQNLESTIKISDLDGDGRNELITGLPLGGQPDGRPPLAVYGDGGRPRFEVYLQDTINFNGTSYDGSLAVSSLGTYTIPGSAEREIFALASRGRSPNVLFRVSRKGEILGRYFHFGYGIVDTLRWPGDSKPYLVFGGQNNVHEPDSLTYPVLGVLDPEKIEGKSQAGDSPGFALAPSTAERYLIRLPLTDMNKLLGTPGHVGYFRMTSDAEGPHLEVRVEGNYLDPEIRMGMGPAYFVIFSPDMKIADVKFESVTMRLRQKLVDQGKLPPKSIEAFLAELREGVLYWNGTAWQMEATPVVRRPDA